MALPSTYRQLAYIQSTGTQYINLNVAPNSVGRMVVDFIPMLANTRQMVVGAWGGTSYTAYLLQLNASNQFLPDMAGVTISGSSKSYVVGTEYLYDCNLNGGTITINGESFKTTSGYSNTSRSYFLFASNDVDDGAYAKASVKLKSLKIYNTSGTLVSDYIPALRISDNVVGLYDFTTNTFRANSGSGTFLYGELVAVTTSVSPSGSGTVSGGGSYASGDSVTLSATPNNGFTFVNFDVGGTTYTANPLTITVSADTTVVANFRSNYDITLNYDSSLGTASYSWLSGTQIQLTATPNSNGQFKGWYVNSSLISSSNPYNYTVTGNVTIEARFERVYNVDASVDGDGAIQYTRGTDKNDVTFSVIPNQNRHFDRYEVEKAVLSFFPMSVLKSAGDVYDEITPTQAIQRIGVDDLGSLTWTRYAISEGYAFVSSIIQLIKPVGNVNTANAVCAKYPLYMGGNGYSMPNDKTFRVGGSYFGLKRIIIRDDSFTDATAFKNSLQGYYLYYELAEPIVNDIQIDLHYSAHQGGTEQLLPVNGTSPVTSPLKADIQYPDELRENQYFTYRECPSTDGEAEITSLKGNTLVWNQISIVPFTEVRGGVTFTRNNDNTTLQMSGTSTSTVYKQFSEVPMTTVGHVYYVDKGADSTLFQLYNDSGGINTQTDRRAIGTATTQKRWYFRIPNGTTIDVTAKPMIIDLTVMFGAGNEPTTTDEFLSLFSLPNYDYNVGELLSFGGTGLKTVGKNLFNSADVLIGKFVDDGNGVFRTHSGSVATNYIEIFPNTEYKIISAQPNGMWGAWYDANKTFIIGLTNYATVKTSPSNAKYMAFTISYIRNNLDYANNVMLLFNGEDETFESYTESTLTFGYAKQIFTTTPLMLHLTSDIIITAYILDDEHFHITATTDFNYGSIYVSDNDVYIGTVVTLWARPFPDYNFVRWQDGSLENPRSIVVTENVTLVAEYQRVSDTNGIYQYRCFVKDQLNLTDPPKAFLRVDTFTVRTDLMTNATSSITVLEMPSNINEGDVLVLYDPKGQFLYNGVVNSIEDKTIGCSQMQSYYKGNWIYSVSSQDFLEHEIAVILKDYADGKLKGSSYIDSLVAERLGGITIDYTGATTANLPTTYEESGDENEDKYEVVDMEEFIYSLYEKYNIVLDFEINFSGTNYVHIKVPSFEKLKVGNNMFAIQNMLPITEIEETNKLVIYDSQNVYRTTFIATKNGIVENPATTANRFNITNTEIVFSDDPVEDLVANNLPNQMFNHKLEYDLIIKNFIYEFGDFNLGGELDIYYGDEYYDSVLTGYEISKSSNQNITQAHFVCGKVRTALTKLLTLSGRV